MILGTKTPRSSSSATANTDRDQSGADISTRTLNHLRCRFPRHLRGAAGTVGSYGTSPSTRRRMDYAASSAHNEFVGGTTYTDTFSVASADGTLTSVTVNILGTNDAAILSSATANLTETNLAADIRPAARDHLRCRFPRTFVAQHGTVGSYGTFAIDAAGAWTYAASSAPTSSLAEPPTPTPSRLRAPTEPSHRHRQYPGHQRRRDPPSATANLTETIWPRTFRPAARDHLRFDFPPPSCAGRHRGSYGTFASTPPALGGPTPRPPPQRVRWRTTYTDTSRLRAPTEPSTSVTVNILGTNDAAILSSATANLTETIWPRTFRPAAR